MGRSRRWLPAGVWWPQVPPADQRLPSDVLCISGGFSGATLVRLPRQMFKRLVCEAPPSSPAHPLRHPVRAHRRAVQWLLTGRSVRVGEVPETAAGQRRGPLPSRAAGLCVGRAGRTRPASVRAAVCWLLREGDQRRPVGSLSAHGPPYFTVNWRQVVTTLAVSGVGQIWARMRKRPRFLTVNVQL